MSNNGTTKRQTSLKQLLKKQKWTAAEAGRVKVAKTVQAVFNSINSDIIEPKIEYTEITKRLAAFNILERETYSGYTDICNWFERACRQAQYDISMAAYFLEHLISTLKYAVLTEDVYSYISQLPAIVTRKQYSDICHNRIPNSDNITDNYADMGFCLLNLIEIELEYYIRLLHRDARRKNPLKPLRKKLEAELVTDSNILNRYCKVTKHKKVPADLNKWEIIESGAISRYYPVFRRKEKTEEEALEQIAAFRKEFTELVTALLQDMEQYIEDVSTLTNEEWLNIAFSWADLYKEDFYNFRQMYNISKVNIFAGNDRAVYNGVAILEASELAITNPFTNNDPRIDEETGYYKPPTIENSLAEYSLEGFFDKSEASEIRIQQINECLRAIPLAYYSISGYHIALQIISERYGTTELLKARFDEEYSFLSERAEDYNNLVAGLHERIQNITYDDKELKQIKLDVLEKLFLPLSVKEHTPPESIIEQAKKDIENFDAFQGRADSLITTLCREK